MGKRIFNAVMVGSTTTWNTQKRGKQIHHKANLPEAKRITTAFQAIGDFHYDFLERKTQKNAKYFAQIYEAY